MDENSFESEGCDSSSDSEQFLNASYVFWIVLLTIEQFICISIIV